MTAKDELWALLLLLILAVLLYLTIWFIEGAPLHQSDPAIHIRRKEQRSRRARRSRQHDTDPQAHQ